MLLQIRCRTYIGGDHRLFYQLMGAQPTDRFYLYRPALCRNHLALTRRKIQRAATVARFAHGRV